MIMTTLEKTKYIINNLGVKQQFICEYLGMNKTSLSEFLSQKRGIKPDNKKKLEELLQNYIIKDAIQH